MDNRRPSYLFLLGKHNIAYDLFQFSFALPQNEKYKGSLHPLVQPSRLISNHASQIIIKAISMKLTLITFLLPLAALGNPIAGPEPEPAAIEKRATCNIISGKEEGCDYDPFHAYRRTPVPLSIRTIHPTCYIANGRSVSGNKKWDWIAEWGCWMSAHNTNSGCESK